MPIIVIVTVLLFVDYVLLFRRAARAFEVEESWADPLAWGRAYAAGMRVLFGEAVTDVQREGQRVLRVALVTCIGWGFGVALVDRADQALRDAFGSPWVIGEVAVGLAFVAGVVLIEALVAPSLRRLRLPALAVLIAAVVVAGALLLG